MPSTDSETTSTPTISVATMSTIAIDLDAGAGLLPRQGGYSGESSPR